VRGITETMIQFPFPLVIKVKKLEIYLGFLYCYLSGNFKIKQYKEFDKITKEHHRIKDI